MFLGMTLIMGLFQERNIMDKLVFQPGFNELLDLCLVFLQGCVLGISLIGLCAFSQRKHI